MILLTAFPGWQLDRIEPLANPATTYGLQIKAGLTHKQIGEMTGCSREMVSRIMKDFENAGYIAVRDRAIHVSAEGVRQLRQTGML